MRLFTSLLFLAGAGHAAAAGFAVVAPFAPNLLVASQDSSPLSARSSPQYTVSATCIPLLSSFTSGSPMLPQALEINYLDSSVAAAATATVRPTTAPPLVEELCRTADTAAVAAASITHSPELSSLSCAEEYAGTRTGLGIMGALAGIASEDMEACTEKICAFNAFYNNGRDVGCPSTSASTGGTGTAIVTGTDTGGTGRGRLVVGTKAKVPRLDRTVQVRQRLVGIERWRRLVERCLWLLQLWWELLGLLGLLGWSSCTPSQLCYLKDLIVYMATAVDEERRVLGW
ncbi:hypothetical protein QBC35DRAFT_455316 [Podospora australis]|uniref:Uncharacterized protein n=1 Tax=Podospora australis TaxID=1536484 RepID=A0AAN6WLM0_9PEZI|nr:hypothetical protein QBC35DRAFT_455316 [Podospora australis]